MAMQRKLWSINALAAELDVDRRTLSRDLQDLEPAQVKRIGSRVEKRWLMADVLEHMDLGREPSRRRGRGGRPIIDAEMVRQIQRDHNGRFVPGDPRILPPVNVDWLCGGLRDNRTAK